MLNWVSLYECKASKGTYRVFYPLKCMKVNTDKGFAACITCFPYFLHKLFTFYFNAIFFLCKKNAKIDNQ